MNPLLYAARKNDLKLLELFKSYPFKDLIDINVKSEDELTALDYLLINWSERLGRDSELYISSFKWLTSLGANISHEFTFNATKQSYILNAWLKRGRSEVQVKMHSLCVYLRVLSSIKDDLKDDFFNLVPKEEWLKVGKEYPILHTACEMGNLDLIQKLIDIGLSPNEFHAEYGYPLEFINKKDALVLMVKKGADITLDKASTINGSGSIFLKLSKQQTDKEFLSLLSRAAQATQNKSSVSFVEGKIVKVKLDENLKVDLMDSISDLIRGNDFRKKEKIAEIIRVMGKKNIWDVKNSQEENILTIALKGDLMSLARQALEKSVDTNALDQNGSTPFSILWSKEYSRAEKDRNYENRQLMFDEMLKKIKINLRAPDGRTYLEILGGLRLAGCNVNGYGSGSVMMKDLYDQLENTINWDDCFEKSLQFSGNNKAPVYINTRFGYSFFNWLTFSSTTGLLNYFKPYDIINTLIKDKDNSTLMRIFVDLFNQDKTIMYTGFLRQDHKNIIVKIYNEILSKIESDPHLNWENFELSKSLEAIDPKMGARFEDVIMKMSLKKQRGLFDDNIGAEPVKIRRL